MGPSAWEIKGGTVGNRARRLIGPARGERAAPVFPIHAQARAVYNHKSYTRVSAFQITDANGVGRFSVGCEDARGSAGVRGREGERCRWVGLAGTGKQRTDRALTTSPYIHICSDSHRILAKNGEASERTLNSWGRREVFCAPAAKDGRDISSIRASMSAPAGQLQRMQTRSF